ncbi:MAG: PRC-barrel domain-containing protein [Segetibacter sp.]
MENENKNLCYLHELSDYEVASGYTDVRGWKVKDGSGQIVGEVEGLLVNKAAKRVVYLDVEVDNAIIEQGHKVYATPANEGVHEFLNKDGEDHLIIPIGMANLNDDDNEVYCDNISSETFSKAKRYSKGSDIDRKYETVLYAYYSGDDLVRERVQPDDDFYEGDLFYKNKSRDL